MSNPQSSSRDTEHSTPYFRRDRDLPLSSSGAEFVFTRGKYEGGDSWTPRWAVDYPKADRQFLTALKRLTLVRAFPDEHAVPIENPQVGDFPFIYVLEVGSLNLDTASIERLRHYLMAGGFLIVDDFWGSWEWEHFHEQMRLLFPGREVEEVPLDHPVFSVFYRIDEVLQVPNVYQAGSGQTHERDGRIPHVRGIFDDDGRLMVLINWNTDLGDGWEWADAPTYPLRYSTYAYEVGVNFVIYALSH